MPSPDTAFKQLLLAAVTSPQVKAYPTAATAHRARFAMYDAMRQMRRKNPPDPYGEMKDLLEFIVRERGDGKAELRIQRKSTNLMDTLEGWTYADTGEPVSAPRINTAPLQQQLINETANAIDPTSPEDLRIMRRMEINDWLEQMEGRLGFPYMEVITALRTAGDVSLQQFQLQLQDKGIWK